MQKTRTTIHVGPKLTPVHFDLDLSQFSQRNIWDWIQSKDKFYEWEVVRILEQTLKPGDTFIDVGAHVGYFSLIAAALVGPTGRVYCADIDEQNIEAIYNNAVHVNHFKNISQSYIAVGRENRLCAAWLNADNDGGHALWDVGLHDYNQKSRANPNKTQVWMQSLDDWIGSTGTVHPTLIKIDTEGAEYDVLIGATNLLAKNPDCVVIAEINDFGLHQMGANRTQLRDLMERMGYRTFHLSADSEPHELGPDEWPADNGTVFNVMFRK